jgi:hypothetical protein
MREQLTKSIRAKHANIDIKVIKPNRTHILNYPYKGIIIAIKSDSIGLFVFSFHDFKILAHSNSFDYKDFSKYVERKLKALKLYSVNFWRSGNAIYVYIKDSQYREDDTFCLKVFNDIIKEFQCAMKDIEKAVSNCLS